MGSCGYLVWMFFTSKENRGVGLAVILGKKTHKTRILMSPLRALQGLWKSFKKQLHSVLSPRTKPTVYRADPTKFASSLRVQEAIKMLSSAFVGLCEVSIKGVREVGQWCKVLILWIQIKWGHMRGGRRQKRGWHTNNITLVARRQDHGVPLASLASHLMIFLMITLAAFWAFLWGCM